MSTTGVVRYATMRLNVTPASCPKATDTVRSWNAEGPQGVPGLEGVPGSLSCSDELRVLAAVPTFAIREECVPPATTTTSTTTLLMQPSNLWTWGINNGQYSPTCSGSGNDWESIDADGYHSLAIKADGTLWAWGRNGEGEVGDGTTITRSEPTRIGSASDWASVSAGGNHSFAIKDDGTLWAWGYNGNGQLGDGTTVQRTTPAQVGTATNWAAVSTGSQVLAVRTDGTLWAWGENFYGQLGDGTTIQRTTPTRVGTATNWASVSAGSSHSLAIKGDGTLWAWGDNSAGELGQGTSTSAVLNPTQVGSSSDWALVSAVGIGSLAIKDDGSLWAWGYNASGQLGDGTTVNRWSPTQIGSATDWAVVAAGSFGYHSLAIKNDGTLWAWGYNSYGQLGDGTAVSRSIPTQIGSGTNWTQVAAGQHHSVALSG